MLMCSRRLAAAGSIAFTLAGCASISIDDRIDRLTLEAVAENTDRQCDVRKGWNYTEHPDWRHGRFDLQNHVVVAGSDGHLLNRSGSNRDVADGLIKNIVRWSGITKAANAPARVAFYFNGGLNARETVLQQAARQVPCMLSDDIYPVFMVWDTQLWRSYGEQVFSLRDGQLSNRRHYGTGALYVLGDAIEGLGRAPSTYAAQGRRFVDTFRPDRACHYTVLASRVDGSCPPLHRIDYVGPDGQVTGNRNVLVDPAQVDEVPHDVLGDVTYALLLPSRLLLTPVVDGMGNTAWSNFLRRTRTPIRKPREFNLDWSTCLESWQEDRESYPGGTGAFSRVFSLLALAKSGSAFPANRKTCSELHDADLEASENYPEKDAFRKLDVSIMMIGHSMGAIAINELVSTYRDLPYRDIVYMAAAASIRDTRRAIEPLLLLHEKLRFYNLMLHPINDARDRYYAGAVPGGSLLLWIDEMYEPALTPEDKTFGYWPNAKAARHLYWTKAKNDDGADYLIREHMLYRIFNRKKAGCKDDACEPANPTGHGDFNQDEMCFWRPAFWGAAETIWRERYRDLPHGLEVCRAKPAGYAMAAAR